MTMMLLRTLVLARSGEDAPVNGALLCSFAVPQIGCNFLVYSLDEEAEPGSSRVYIAVLRRKLERYYLGAVDAPEELQLAMQVFKQILTWAASGTNPGDLTDTQIPYHFVDLKGCKLPPARPEDHHSLIIKKALVMKVITLGMSSPAQPAIESATLIVPSIRFSSKMSSGPRVVSPAEPAQGDAPECHSEEPQPMPVQTSQANVSTEPVAPSEPEVPVPPQLPVAADNNVLFEMDSTLNNLARVAQELTQQKRAVIEREAALEQWQSRLQQEQHQLEEKTREVEQRSAQLHEQSVAVSQQAEAMNVLIAQASGMRQSLRGMLLELDQVLDR
jgi:hypothetical protein